MAKYDSCLPGHGKSYFLTCIALFRIPRHPSMPDLPEGLIAKRSADRVWLEVPRHESFDILSGPLALIVHWQGGDHSRMTVTKNKIGQTRWAVAAAGFDDQKQPSG
jgi:hypothetical protein